MVRDELLRPIEACYAMFTQPGPALGIEQPNGCKWERLGEPIGERDASYQIYSERGARETLESEPPKAPITKRHQRSSAPQLKQREQRRSIQEKHGGDDGVRT